MLFGVFLGVALLRPEFVKSFVLSYDTLLCKFFPGLCMFCGLLGMFFLELVMFGVLVGRYALGLGKDCGL